MQKEVLLLLSESYNPGDSPVVSTGNEAIPSESVGVGVGSIVNPSILKYTSYDPGGSTLAVNVTESPIVAVLSTGIYRYSATLHGFYLFIQLTVFILTSY